MKYLTITIFLLAITFAKSQSGFNSESIEVTRGDLETNYYEKDTTANAIVLYEYGNSYVDNVSYDLHTEITKKIKILKRAGFEKATIEEHLYHKNDKREKMYDISASTFNLEKNGSITFNRLDQEDIFEEKYNENYDLTKFTLPNVHEGSVITIKYTISSPYFYKYKEWYFQDDIPKLHSEYHTSIPANWEYHIKLVGFKKLFKQCFFNFDSCLKSFL